MSALGSDYDDKIVEAITSVENPSDENRITFSTGVQLATKPFSVMRIQNVISQFKIPEAPLVHNDGKGRLERNPDHPAYVQLVEEINTQRAMAVIDAIIVFGTTLADVPESVPHLTSDEWVEELEMGGVTARTDKPLARYLSWVKYVAMQGTDDMMIVSQLANRVMGVSEEAITQQMRENFPDHPAR